MKGSVVGGRQQSGLILPPFVASLQESDKLSFLISLMGPQCVSQNSAVGIKGHNRCGVSWLGI